MPSIQVIGVTKAYGSKRLFTDVGVNFTERRRYGLTGRTGWQIDLPQDSLGEIESDSGSVSRPQKTSVLRQDISSSTTRTSSRSS